MARDVVQISIYEFAFKNSTNPAWSAPTAINYWVTFQALGFVANTCYYLGHWLFAWKYKLVSNMINRVAKGREFSQKAHVIVQYVICAMIFFRSLCSISVSASPPP